MELKLKIKHFNELSALELYDLLKLRSQVFVVEQNCVYQDIDGKDSKALHVIGEYDGKIVAYSRLFKAGDYFNYASIGRVVIDENFRNKKWGHILIQGAISGIESHFGESQIKISAQLYLKKFYENNGFVMTSKMYLEDGIPHVEMVKG